MTQSELIQEVEQVISQAIDAGRTFQAKWLTHEIVGNHPNIEGIDADWYTLCAHGHVRDAVREVLRRKKDSEGGEGGSAQLVLDGFEKLQRYYLIDRDGDQVGVPIDQLSTDEINAKIGELQRMASGCMKHAEELGRYRDSRQETATLPALSI